MSRRHDMHMAIVKLLNDKLDGVSHYSNVYENVNHTIVFWDEISDYPWIGVSLGDELRDYETSGIKWGYLQFSVRVYVKEEEHGDSLNQFLEDIENLFDSYTTLVYDDKGSSTVDITLQNITTDQGVLAPLGVGELTYLIKYMAYNTACCPGPDTPYPCP